MERAKKWPKRPQTGLYRKKALTCFNMPTILWTGIRGEKRSLRRQGKRTSPFFLSIGYSTCHWCHVMEKESFSGFHPNMVVLLRLMGKGGGSLIDSIASFLSNYGPVKDKITAYLCEGFACVPPPLSLMTSIGCWLERGTKEAVINTGMEII